MFHRAQVGCWVASRLEADKGGSREGRWWPGPGLLTAWRNSVFACGWRRQESSQALLREPGRGVGGSGPRPSCHLSSPWIRRQGCPCEMSTLLSPSRLGLDGWAASEKINAELCELEGEAGWTGWGGLAPWALGGRRVFLRQPHLRLQFSSVL